jgi:hypothetical protein
MNHLITGVLIVLLLMTSCIKTVDEQRRLLQGEWNFESVYAQQGQYSKDISSDDVLIISQDYSFMYRFENEDEIFTGSWETGRDHSIRFIYHQQAGQKKINVINYTIDSLTTDILILRDPNGVVYNLSR